jgi:hypothetical protein
MDQDKLKKTTFTNTQRIVTIVTGNDDRNDTFPTLIPAVSEEERLRGKRWKPLLVLLAC